jgi:site-specific recombinase XerD
MEADLRLRNLQPSTRGVYLGCVRRFAAYHMRSPDQMGELEVREYLAHLRDKRKLDPKTIRCNVAALRFLYANTLGRPGVVACWLSPRTERRLPVVLSRTEVDTLLKALRSLKYRAVAMTMYGAGLRVREACHLQVDDLDAHRGLLFIRDGKGGRERYAMLSRRLLEELRTYWMEARPAKPYLFPGQYPQRPLSPRSVQRVLRIAANDCGITKHVTPHTLRHSFATHLLDAGIDIRVIQALLGHRSIRTTQIYTQVSSQHVRRVQSPLDLLGTEEAKTFA